MHVDGESAMNINRRQAIAGLSAAAAYMAGNLTAHAAARNSAYKDIYAYIDKNYDSHLAKIQEFVRQKSISAQDIGMRECASLLAGYIRELGAKTELAETDGYPVVFGKYDIGAPRTILIYCLYDVVYAVEEEWSSPPFAANLVQLPGLGQAIIGRGVANQKGPLCALINAMASIIAIRGELPVNVLFAIEGEEEISSVHLGQFVTRYMDQLKQADACFFPTFAQSRSGNPVVTLGNKGIVYMELHVDGKHLQRGPKQFDLVSYHQNIVEGPVWYLVEALASLTDKNGTKILVEGINSKVVEPSSFDRELIKAVTERINVEKDWGALMQVEEFADALTGQQLMERHLLTSSLNIDGIWAGFTDPGKVNTVLPKSATAKIDVRLVPNLKKADVAPAIRQHLHVHGFDAVEVRVLSGYEMSRTSIDAQVVQALLGTYEDYELEYDLYPMMAASNPSYLFTDPPLSLGKVNGGIGHGGNIHSVDEYLIVEGEGPIADLPDAEKFYVDFLYKFATT